MLVLALLLMWLLLLLNDLRPRLLFVRLLLRVGVVVRLTTRMLQIRVRDLVLRRARVRLRDIRPRARARADRVRRAVRRRREVRRVPLGCLLVARCGGGGDSRRRRRRRR